jgi:hypothetical protein
VRDAVTIEESEIIFHIGLDQIDGFLEKSIEDKNNVALSE